MLVSALVYISDLYLFHLIDFLNPVFNCYKGLLLSSVDKLTTMTYNLASSVLNVVFIGLWTEANAGSASRSVSLVVLLVLHSFYTKLK